MRPYIHTRGSTIHKFMWVTDCSVGKHAQNSVPEDVSFLQWYYVLAADYSETSPQHKSIYKNVSITGKCFGHPVIDGKASVVHGLGFVDDKAFFVLRLGARFASMYPTLWPRLDLIPSCPPLIAVASRAAIPQRSEI